MQPTCRPTVGSPSTGSSSRYRHIVRGRLAIACPAQRRADGVVVVGDLERPEVVRTKIKCFLGIELAAKATLQPAHEFSHRRFSFDSEPILPGQGVRTALPTIHDSDGYADDAERSGRIIDPRRSNLDRYGSGNEGDGRRSGGSRGRRKDSRKPPTILSVPSAFFRNRVRKHAGQELAPAFALTANRLLWRRRAQPSATLDKMLPANCQ